MDSGDILTQINLIQISMMDENISAFLHNYSHFLNASRNIDLGFIERFQLNRRVNDAAFYSLIAVYVVLILLGATGNSLVVCAVIRKPAMRTARNMFIINLAISDLLLCLFTMPLTLMEILTKYWPLGSWPFLCRLVASLQATSIFVSTISITAIALDRYQVIVYPTKENLQKVGAVIILSCIWLVSFLFALPLFIWRTLKHHKINLVMYGVETVDYCLEEWPTDHGRAYYSIFSIILQYVAPIITVSIAYASICRKLRYRMANSSISQKKQQKDDRRMKRTNTLLVTIALIFCVSWLPLNIFNVVVDLANPFRDEDTETMMIIYAICHMMGMSSACSNPLLYGWLNDNFRNEFKEIGMALCPYLPICDRVRRDASSYSCRSSVSRVQARGGKDAGVPSSSAVGDAAKHPAGSRRHAPKVTYRKAPTVEEATENGSGVQVEMDVEETMETQIVASSSCVSQI